MAQELDLLRRLDLADVQPGVDAVHPVERRHFRLHVQREPQVIEADARPFEAEFGDRSGRAQHDIGGHRARHLVGVESLDVALQRVEPHGLGFVRDGAGAQELGRPHLRNPAGTVPGFVHLYCGQEAVAVGACMNLLDTDYIGSTHRGHGHCIAKGCDIGAMLLEIYCKQGGLGNGKGGSMHIADLKQRHARCQRHRRRRSADCDRCSAYPENAQDRWRRHGVHRRRCLEPGHGGGIAEFLGGAQAADDLHVREQRLLRVHGHRLPPGRRRHRGPRGGFWHAG